MKGWGQTAQLTFQSLCYSGGGGSENLKGSKGGMGDRERVGLAGNGGGQTYQAVALTIIRQKTGKALLPSITNTAVPRKEHASC